MFIGYGFLQWISIGTTLSMSKTKTNSFITPFLHFSETCKSVKNAENNNNLTLESGVRQVELGVSSALDTSKVGDG